MDLRLLRGDRGALWLRPYAAAGLALAALCGALLFVTQAVDYAANGWFRAKLVVLALALANVAVHPRLADLPDDRRRIAAGLSLALWPVVVLLGRMIGFA